MKNHSKKLWLIPLIALVILAAVYGIYVSDYYRADPEAIAALASDETVTVTATDYGWHFDGPSEDTALIFYPGAKVEETAYAPFLRRLAEIEMDVCLVKMPFHMAFLGVNKADDIISSYSYDNWYIGGHSLGGAMSASYASKHGDALAGVILCAAYPVSELDDDLNVVMIYGSDDQVLNMERVAQGVQLSPSDLTEYVINGGNHAQFGNYGLQQGDGEAEISAEEQQEEAVEAIASAIGVLAAE